LHKLQPRNVCQGTKLAGCANRHHTGSGKVDQAQRSPARTHSVRHPTEAVRIESGPGNNRLSGRRAHRILHERFDEGALGTRAQVGGGIFATWRVEPPAWRGIEVERPTLLGVALEKLSDGWLDERQIQLVEPIRWFTHLLWRAASGGQQAR
jgi:hypothetical protein